MIKSILVPVGGGPGDQAVLETALTVAKPISAHLEFLHVRLSGAEAAVHTPHFGYAIGGAVRSGLRRLAEVADSRAAAAAHSVEQFCARAQIRMAEGSVGAGLVTARWHREEGDALAALLFHARRNDLAIMTRAKQPDGLPKHRLETLLLNCGRPLLLVPTGRPLSVLDTAIVCWDESAAASRAVSAALSLLCIARRVLLLTVSKDAGSANAALAGIAAYLARHGIATQSEVQAPERRATADVLLSAARRSGADLLVMGGYGHAHAREVLFGGCTQAVIEEASLPVVLMH